MANYLQEKYYTLTKSITNKEKARYYPSSLNEWNNSIYNFNSNITKNIHIKDVYVGNLLKSYFNIKKIFSKKRKFSITRVFVGQHYITHFNNKVYITICTYDKEKTYFNKYMFSLYKKLFIKTWYEKTNSKNLNSIFSSNKLSFLLNKSVQDLSVKGINNIDIILKYKKLYILLIQYMLKRYKKLFVIRKKIIRLKFMDYKYNINNFMGLKNILYKIYDKKVEFNIISLKYLYLDSNILNEAIGAKLKNRKSNLLKNIMKSIGLVKIPYIKDYIKTSNFNNFDVNKINLFLNPGLMKKDTSNINESLYGNTQKLSIMLYNLKHKIIRGVKVEGAGRLTERLTALRSVSKVRQKGSLKNIYSSYYKLSSIMLLGYLKSNMHYVKKNYSNRNGSYGIKTHISSL